MPTEHLYNALRLAFEHDTPNDPANEQQARSLTDILAACATLLVPPAPVIEGAELVADHTRELILTELKMRTALMADLHRHYMSQASAAPFPKSFFENELQRHGVTQEGAPQDAALSPDAVQLAILAELRGLRADLRSHHDDMMPPSMRTERDLSNLPPPPGAGPGYWMSAVGIQGPMWIASPPRAHMQQPTGQMSDGSLKAEMAKRGPIPNSQPSDPLDVAVP